MDIKLRDISRKKLTKCIVFTLDTILITLTFMQLVYIQYINVDLESVFVRDYKVSRTFAYEVNKAIKNTYALLKYDTGAKFINIDYFYLIKYDAKFFSNAPIYYKRFFEGYKDTFFSYENGIYTTGNSINPSLVELPSEKKTILCILLFQIHSWKNNKNYGIREGK